MDLGQIQSELTQLVEAVNMLQTGQATLDEQSSVLAAGWNEYYAGLSQLEAAQSTIDTRVRWFECSKCGRSK